MTKPTARLAWWPDPANPHAITALWFGAGWHYILEWGHLDADGKPAADRVSFWETKPVRHVYPNAGRYALTGRPGLPNAAPVVVEVTLRDKVKPDASFELVDGHKVRASLERLDDQVRYRVAWGDGQSSTHDVHDLAPVHEYPWGFGTPQITVTDLPARRAAVFTGPQIGPEPGPLAIDGFFFEHVSTTDTHRRFRLRGGGITPGTEITWYPHGNNGTSTLTADEHGQVSDTIDLKIIDMPEFDYRWRSYTVMHEGRVTFVPLHAPRCAAGEPNVTYQIHEDDPHSLTFSATPPTRGQHVIDFGDGTTRQVDVTALPLRVDHTYSGGGPYTVRITLPDKRVAQGTVRGSHPCPPCHNPNYPGSCSVIWYKTGGQCAPCGESGSDAFAPVRIDNGFHPVHQIHRPENGNAWHVGFGYDGFPPGDYTFNYLTALEPARNHRVNIAKAAPVKRLDGPSIELIHVDEDETEQPLTATFGNVKEWDGGYSGEFTIRNHDAQPQAWAVEFALSDPAVLREVWPSSAAQYTELPGNRWRIWSTTPLAPTASVRIGTRIEPPGKTKRFPTDITARPWPGTNPTQEEN